MTRTADVDGVTVHYLGTPVRYRWMGVTPTIHRRLSALERPDVLHVFGFRDLVGTFAAGWARRQGVPSCSRGSGWSGRCCGKWRFKRALDGSVYRPVLDGARLLVAASSRERNDYLDAGVDANRVVLRPIGFPAPAPALARPGPLRERLGLDAAVPLLLSVGRVAPGKGIDLLVRALTQRSKEHTSRSSARTTGAPPAIWSGWRGTSR